jgi:uncharacterized protein YqiB (DUF1249 family)
VQIIPLERDASFSKTRRYVPDLKGFMNDCDANYLRFLQLLPAMQEVDSWVFGVETLRDRPLSRVCLRVIERSRYTTTVTLEQEYDYPEWLPSPLITVRLYHDARMAEVLAYQRSAKIRQSYDYPNGCMYQRDEKAQLNALLGEWLQHCLKSGCALDLPAF